MTDLLSCPFCPENETRSIRVKHRKRKGDYLVRCFTCGGSGPPSTSPETAAWLWNQTYGRSPCEDVREVEP